MGTRIPGRIVSLEDRTGDIRVLTLSPSEPFMFRAGQYARLSLDGFEARPFSMAARPEKEGLITFHIRNTGTGLSNALSSAKKGDTVFLEGPYGIMDVSHVQNRPVLMVCGGTGIAPMLAMAQEILRQGLTEEGINLIFGVRSRGDIYCRPELEALASSGEVKTHEAVGEITPLNILAADNTSLDRHIAYICGPAPMVLSTRDVLLTRGIRASSIFYDDWSKDTA